MLTRTANGWLKNAAGADVPAAPEQDLQTAILEDDEFEPTLDALIPNRAGTAVRIVPISESEKWEAFQELAAELYPDGPDDDGLWERAGGDDADLSTGRNGRTRWRNALRKMRNGKEPTPSALLAKMMEDFPHNERIPHLASDPVFAEPVEDNLRDA